MTVETFQSWNFQVQFDPAEFSADELPLVRLRGQSLPAGCEADLKTLCAWFGVVPSDAFGPSNRVSVTLTKHVRGASNWGYSKSNSRMLVNCNLGGTDDSVLSLFVAEMSEILMSLKGKWNRGDSTGEGLSRVCADLLHPASSPMDTNNNVNAWLASDPTQDSTSAVADTEFRKDWVSMSFAGGPLRAGDAVAGDQDSYSFGCAMLFINYLRSQLGYTEAEIIQLGQPTLGATYSSLTGLQDSGFGPFRRLVDVLFPPTAPSASSDNPFPLVFADHFYTTSAGEHQALTHPKATRLHRLVSLDNGDHLYTTSWAERVQARNYNYRYEAVSSPAYVHATPAPGTVPLYRLLNASTGEHFYTADAAEMAAANARNGFATEGICGYVFNSQVPNSIPLFRLRNTKDNKHFYTTLGAEAEYATQHLGYVSEGTACWVYAMEGYADEGIACYVMPGPRPGTTPLYRMASTLTLDHLYTSSQSERDHVLATQAYRDEGVACHVFTDHVARTVPFFRLYQPRSGDHLYTASAVEHDAAIAKYGYVDEGIVGYVRETEGAGAVALYRHYGTTPAHF